MSFKAIKKKEHNKANAGIKVRAERDGDGGGEWRNGREMKARNSLITRTIEQV